MTQFLHHSTPSRRLLSAPKVTGWRNRSGWRIGIEVNREPGRALPGDFHAPGKYSASAGNGGRFWLSPVSGQRQQAGGVAGCLAV